MADPYWTHVLHDSIARQDFVGLRSQLQHMREELSSEQFQMCINAADDRGLTLINAAIQWEQYPEVDILLEAGADILRAAPVVTSERGPDEHQTQLAKDREQQLDRWLCVVARLLLHRRRWSCKDVSSLLLSALQTAHEAGSVLLTLPLLTQEPPADLPEEVKGLWSKLRTILMKPTRVIVPHVGVEPCVARMTYAGRLKDMVGWLHVCPTVQERKAALLVQNQDMPYGMPAIVAAASAGHTDLLRYLHFFAEADLGFTVTARDFAEVKDRRGWNALSAAVRGWQVQTTAFLCLEVCSTKFPFCDQGIEDTEWSCPTFHEQLMVLALAEREQSIVKQLATVGWYADAGADQIRPHQRPLPPKLLPSQWCAVSLRPACGQGAQQSFDVLRDAPASLYSCVAYHWLGTPDVNRIVQWLAQVAWEQSGQRGILAGPVHEAQALCDLFQCSIQVYQFAQPWQSMTLGFCKKPQKTLHMGSTSLQGQTLRVLQDGRVFYYLKPSAPGQVMAVDGRQESDAASYALDPTALSACPEAAVEAAAGGAALQCPVADGAGAGLRSSSPSGVANSVNSMLAGCVLPAAVTVVSSMDTVTGLWAGPGGRPASAVTSGGVREQEMDRPLPTNYGREADEHRTQPSEESRPPDPLMATASRLPSHRPTASMKPLTAVGSQRTTSFVFNVPNQQIPGMSHGASAHSRCTSGAGASPAQQQTGIGMMADVVPSMARSMLNCVQRLPK